MALRLAGEEFSVVQGLDDQGWLEKTTKDLLVEKNDPRIEIKDTRASGLAVRLNTDINTWILRRVDTGDIPFYVELNTSTLRLKHSLPYGNDAYDLGSVSQAWRYLYVGRLQNPGTGDGGAVFVDDALTVMSNLKLGGTVTNYSCLKRPMTNRNAARTMVAQEVVKLDTANDQSIVDTSGAAELNPFVVVDGEAPGNNSTVAVGGVCLVNCDTAAVNRGDLLVVSATALKATVDNTMTDVRKILGIALTAKGAGAAGTVLILIKTL